MANKKLLSNTLETVEAEENAIYYQDIESNSQGGYSATTYYLDGAKRFTGHYLDKEATEEHGWFQFFHRNGQLESEGLFSHGRKTGPWKRWDTQGKPKTTRLYRKAQTPEKVTPAVYAGGEGKLSEDLARSLKTAVGSKVIDFDATVDIAFTVNEEGMMINPQIISSDWSRYNEIAMEAIQALSLWIPAKRNGVAFESIYVLPIQFKRPA